VIEIHIGTVEIVVAIVAVFIFKLIKWCVEADKEDKEDVVF